MRRTSRSVLGIALAAALAGCGGDPVAPGPLEGGGGPTGPAEVATTPAEGATTPAGGESPTGGDGGGAGVTGELCELLSQEEASDALGAPASEPQYTPGEADEYCLYSSDEGGLIQLHLATREADYGVLKQTYGPESSAVPGLGEDAFFHEDIGVIVNLGDSHVQVFVATESGLVADREVSTATAAIVVGRL